MTQALFRLYGILEDFLPARQRGKVIPVTFSGPQSVKHLLEGLDVPHPEIGQVYANGQPVSLDYLVRPGDYIEAHPTPNGHPDTEDIRFALDGHLGRLAAYLRLLGFDTWYQPQVDDPELAQRAAAEERILLTRDRDLLKRKIVRHGYWIRHLKPEAQLREVVERFALREHARPFQRCLACNGLLEPVPKAEIVHLLQPLTKRYFDKFHRCPQCGRIYWQGSHYQRLERLVNAILIPKDGSS